MFPVAIIPVVPPGDIMPVGAAAVVERPDRPDTPVPEECDMFAATAVAVYAESRQRAIDLADQCEELSEMWHKIDVFQQLLNNAGEVLRENPRDGEIFSRVMATLDTCILQDSGVLIEDVLKIVSVVKDKCSSLIYAVFSACIGRLSRGGLGVDSGFEDVCTVLRSRSYPSPLEDGVLLASLTTNGLNYFMLNCITRPPQMQIVQCFVTESVVVSPLLRTDKQEELRKVIQDFVGSDYTFLIVPINFGKERNCHKSLMCFEKGDGDVLKVLISNSTGKQSRYLSAMVGCYSLVI